MAFKIVISDRALDDLSGIYDYIAIKLSNVRAAQKLRDNIFKTIDDIELFPYGCPIESIEKFAKLGYRRGVIRKNFIMFYKIDEANDRIIIARIIYAKRNLRELDV